MYRHNRPVEDADLKTMNDAPVKWEQLRGNIFKKKEEILALQNDEVEKIKERVRKSDIIYEQANKELMLLDLLCNLALFGANIVPVDPSPSILMSWKPMISSMSII